MRKRMRKRVSQHFLEKDFLFKLGDLFIDKWVTICIVKLENRPFHVAMATTQVKELKNDIFKVFFLDSDFRNGISNY